MAQNSLLSPGIQVSVIDESNYSVNAEGTIPFILMATAQDKTNASGSLATGTAKANAGQIYSIGDQRTLANLFGLPQFPNDASGNRIYGSELAEYGLYAAHNILGTISSAYVMRADIDLAALEGSQARPTNPAAAGTVWLDTTTAEWGVFEWNSTLATFVRKKALFLSNASDLDGEAPSVTVGKIGDYAVVGYDNIYNPTYYKNYMNEWELVGSANWQKSHATVIGTVANANNITPGDSIVINGSDPIEATGTSAASFVNDITLAGIVGVVAKLINGKVHLFADSTAKSDGATHDGKILITNDSGTIPTKLGLTVGTAFNVPTVQFSKHSNIPSWKSGSGIRPSGSVWIKTTSFNHGANLTTFRKNGVNDTWDIVANPLYENDGAANYALDPTRGGLGIARGTLYTEYDIYNEGTVSYSTLTRLVSGPTVVTGSTAPSSLTATGAFTISASETGSTSYTSPVTITVPSSPNNRLSNVVGLISAADILDVEASISSTGNIVITHTAGGAIKIDETSGNILSELGITTDLTNVRSNNDGTITLSNWVLSDKLPTNLQIKEAPYAPVSMPDDGSLWFYSSPLEVDIMINDNNVWRGYRNVEDDIRGFDLTATDPNGPIIGYSKPTQQSNGDALSYGDLWVDTSDKDNYPAIWRWERKNNLDQWIAIDIADRTTEHGIVFADARWDGDGMADVLSDDLPTIADLLTNDNIDLDAPEADLYPNGCLLFNTRRSSNNVKKYVENYFNQTDFPEQSLPDVTATWQSVSGKAYNNVPFFGRKAQRNVVVSALSAAIENSVDVTEEGKTFNLLVCPGYPELLDTLKVLNDNRKNTGFVLGEVPMGLSTDLTTVERYVTDASGTGKTSEFGIVINDPYTAVFFPGAATVNAVDGVGTIVIPMSAAILRTVVKNDQNGEIWFAPAGNTRGTVDVLSIGFVDRQNNNAFVKTGSPQGIRDILYPNKVNPVTYLPQVGYVNYGNHTRQANNTALDRINVARLTSYLRSKLEQTIRPFIFEPNDTITRNTVRNVCEGLLNELVARRGIYDYVVQCDRANNDNARIDRNELHVDIAIEPVKSIEFIYIPIRIKATGQIASGNLTPAIALDK